jgi:predicted transcriptional regulator of viral defense system
VDGKSRTPDAKVADLAARQHGVVARWQLRRLKLGKGWIDHRLEVGALHPVFRGVYAVGHAKVTPRGRLMAAVLACGPDAVLSHRDAAVLWGIGENGRRRIDVTVPGRRRKRREDIDMHLVRSLHPNDRTEIDGIPVTSLERTLLDISEIWPQRRTERAIEAAERNRIIDVKAIEELMKRTKGRRLRPLKAALTSCLSEGVHTKQELERLFLDVCRDYGIPLPQVNVAIAGYEVDAAWPERKLVVELDSRRFHHTTRAFERDRDKDAALQLAEMRVVRLTWQMLQNPAAAAAKVLGFL